jgi:hypothetical protein
MAQQQVGERNAGAANATRRISRLTRLVVLLGAAFEALSVLLGNGEDSSVLWFLAPLLMAVFIAGLWRASRHSGAPFDPVTRLPPALLFIGGSWLAGMIYELALRTGSTGFGGMAPDTGASFLLAQGFYVPFAIGGWWLARRYGYSLQDVFWTGALVSLYEAITAGATTVAAQPALLPLAPLMAGYYLTVYGYILAMPLLFVDERRVWASTTRPRTAWRKAVYGVTLGLACWTVFVGWAALLPV